MRFAGPDSEAPLPELTDTLNLDANGKPLTYSSAKRGPDRLAWERVEAEEIIRLILTGTIFPIPHSRVPKDRWTNNKIVYYNPVVKQKRNDDGTIQFRVRGTAGGNLLNVPYDFSAKTTGLDTVKLLIHSVISGDFKWMTIDITKLSQTRLIQHLKENGYTQCPNTPCLFRHHTREIMFCLVVDDFGVRYKTQADADHLISTLEKYDYKLKV